MAQESNIFVWKNLNESKRALQNDKQSKTMLAFIPEYISNSWLTLVISDFVVRLKACLERKKVKRGLHGSLSDVRMSICL